MKNLFNYEIDRLVYDSVSEDSDSEIENDEDF